MNISQAELNTANDLTGFISFRPNFLLWALLQCEADIILLDTGNQAGKNASIIENYILRIRGEHPIKKKNMTPETPIRVLRFASEKLPTESEGMGEVSNTVYPQLKKFLPPSMIKKDITARRPALTLKPPQGGDDIIIEFTSYNQELQTQAGHQRWSVYLDEESPRGFYEEQIPRLLAASSSGSGGDIIIGLTPAEKINWIYEDIYNRAGIFYYSDSIIEYLKQKDGTKLERIEYLNRDHKIAVIRAATDDNPTLDIKAIEEKMSAYDDEATMEIRRYGIFHQISGVIHKAFDPRIHVINKNRYFEDGIPHEWLHTRGVDFHEHTNWACGWMVLSNQNEAFIYNEYNPSPDRMVTLEIAKQVAIKSEDYKYSINLVDPRMAIKQTNTGFTPLDDFNRVFHEFKRNGIGTGGYWQTWDTKNLKGRDAIKERFLNSRLVGKPFNNRIVRDGIESYLPTLWILDNCLETIKGFKNWAWEQWSNTEALLTKEEKNKPQDRFSHFPITFECLFKSPVLSIGKFKGSILPERSSGYERYMRARI